MSSVCFFLPALEGGGAERVTLTIAAGLADRGHDVELVVADRRGPLADDVPPQLRVVDLGRPRVSTSARALRAHLRRTRPDAVVSALFHANLVALTATRGLGIPVVVVEHNTMSVKFASTVTRRDRLAPLACAAAYRLADQVGAVSEGVADDMAVRLRLPRSRVRVLRNPVDFDEVRRRAAEPVEGDWPPGLTDAGRQQHGPVVLAVGRLTYQKNFDLLLRAVARVPQVRLLVLGEGPDRSELERLVEELGLADRVALPGFVPNPYPSFARADVIAMSSRWEGLPTVLLEALPFPARIVSTDCPSGPVEILDGGRLGRLVPMDDVAALAAAVGAAAAEEPIDRAEAVARYDLPAAVADYEAVIADVVAARAAGRGRRSRG